MSGIADWEKVSEDVCVACSNAHKPICLRNFPLYAISVPIATSKSSGVPAPEAWLIVEIAASTPFVSILSTTFAINNWIC